MRAYTTTVKKYYKWGNHNITLVGSPTVSNGVLGGFSTANYATVFNIPSATSIELGGKFSYTTSITGISCIFDISTTSYTGFNIAVQNNRIRLWTNSQTVSSAIEVGVTYWFRCECNSSGSILYLSTDGKNYTKKLTLTNNEFSSWTGSLFSLGVRYHNKTEPFTGGSIYLEDCYMKINNSRVWTGLKMIESTSSDYDFSEDVDICKAYKTTVRKYYKYTNWTQPKLTANGTIGGTSFAVSASSEYDAPRKAYCAFDGITTNNGTSGCWHSAQGHPSWIQFYNPKPLKVSKLTVYNISADQAFINSYGVSYSDNGSTFTEFKTGTSPSQANGTSWDIVIDAGAHKYWRLTSKSSSGSNNGYTAVGEIKITAQEFTEGNEKDYTSYEDVNVYKLITGFNRKYYKYIYKNWTQPVLTTNGTMGGSSFAVTQSNLYNSEYAYCAFDANESTQWTNNGNTGYLVFYNPMPINVTKISVMNGYNSSYVRPISSGTLLASNDGNSYITIATFTNSNTTAKGTWNIDVSSNTGYYKYYKLSVVGDGSYARITTLTVTAKERSITEGTESDYDFFKDKFN